MRKRQGAVPGRGVRRVRRRPGAGGAALTADRIREAADQLFCRRGYDAVSVNEIAEAAHTNKALVFYHFGNKERLFERVLERYYHAHREALATSFAGEGTLPVRLHRMVDAYLDFIVHNHRYAALIQQQTSASSLHPLIERNLAPLFRWTQQIMLEVAPSTGPLAARQFFVTFSGVVINYFTYAPLLADLWGEDPLSPRALRERREHVHWMVDVVLQRLERAGTARRRRSS
jgi:TetR/AcrR family transcriptional regulator